MADFFGEFIGTMILLTLGVGVVASVTLKESKAAGGGWIVITLAWGLGVTLGIYASAPFSASHLNPAVTLGMAAIGEFPVADIFPYIAGQLLGGMLGAAIVYFAYLPHFYETDDATTKLGVFATIPAIRVPVANFVTEVIGTFVLVLAILFIGANDFADGLNPFIVGMLIVAIGLSLGGPTGYAINPVRDWAPRLVHTLLPIPGKGTSDWAYAWVPLVGPIIGGVYGAIFYNQWFVGEPSITFWVLTVFVLASFVGAVRATQQKYATR